MKEAEFEVTVEDNTLTLRGERKLNTEVTEEHFHRIERSYGSFARSFALPPTVDAGKVSAEYKAGVLTVRLPMREEAKPKQIKIAVAVARARHLQRGGVAPRLGRRPTTCSGRSVRVTGGRLQIRIESAAQRTAAKQRPRHPLPAVTARFRNTGEH